MIFIPVFPVFFLSPVLFFLSLDLISFYYLFFLLFTVIFCFIFFFGCLLLYLFVTCLLLWFLFAVSFIFILQTGALTKTTHVHTHGQFCKRRTQTLAHTHTNTGTLALNFFSSFSLRLFHFYALYTTASIYLISVSAFR